MARQTSAPELEIDSGTLADAEKFEAILRQLGPTQNEAELARRHLCWQVLAGSAPPH